MTRSRPRIDPSRILWPVVYGMALVLVAGHVLLAVGALTP